MSTKVPLGVKDVENVPVKIMESKATHTVSRMDKRPASEDHVMKLEKEVHALRARLSRRDETISKLQAHSASHASKADLRQKVEEIVKLHDASKAKYQSDLNKLRSTNEQLQQTNDDIKAKETQILAKVSDIRSKLALAEAENARLKKELTSRPLPQAGPSIDEKMTWRKEKAHLEAEVRSMRRDAEERVKLERALLSERQSKEGIRAENERLKYGWAIMAEQYAELHECLVEKQREWSRASRTFAAERERLESNIAVLETDLIARREEVEDLRDHAKASGVERKALAQIIDNLRADSDIANYPVAVDSTLSHKLDNNFEASDIRHMIELASGHLDLVMSNSADTPFHIAFLTETILALEIDLRQRETSLHTLELSHGRLETEHEALKIEHATCGATSSQLRYELDQAEQVIDSRGEEVASVRLELSRAIERGDKQAGLLARANDQAFRSKFAEEALEEEVTHLQNKYLEAAGFEDQYNELLERQAILEAREAVAIEEAERLAMQNAELLGHTNGSQRIGYVDNVRREMALCKHELATTRHLLNVSNDRISILESEIAAYTSVSPESAMVSSSRTRVVRRQPEGSRLATSTSASGATRISVSGPGGARRLI